MGEPNFSNRTLWTADNLDILRGMNSECVDLIYLDPPFNSNRTYAAPIGSRAAGAAFEDTWTLDKLDVAWMGLIADEQPAIANLLHTTSLTHGKGMQSYLTMMAVRLLEMRRILKPTGSIYLHCDTIASHYLKQLMDAVFGRSQYRNEIAWRRYGSHNDTRRKWGRIHDTILFYSKSDDYLWTNDALEPYDGEYLAKAYKHRDANGRYTTAPLHARGLSGGGYHFEWQGVEDIWRFPRERLDALNGAGMIHWPERGKIPRRKVYLNDSKGVPVRDMVLDISIAPRNERTGYPTQKPLALLERIIKASSNEGDLVLDPFCGCATACVAAERLSRQWIGIDISSKAVELVQYRLKQQEPGIALWASQVVARTDIPRRTDISAPKNYRKNKHVLFGQQEGQCNGCKMDFPFKIFEVDHVIPRVKGGTDHIENLQLLCPHCNRVKGSGDQAYLVAQLAAMR